MPLVTVSIRIEVGGIQGITYLWALHENILEDIWPNPLLWRTHADDTCKLHDTDYVGDGVDAVEEMAEVEDREG